VRVYRRTVVVVVEDVGTAEVVADGDLRLEVVGGVERDKDELQIAADYGRL